MRRHPLLAGLAAVLVATAAPAQEPQITVPPGFAVSVFASGFDRARFMAVDPRGTLLLSDPGAGKIVALPDADRDGRADAVREVARGLDLPHGMAFHEGRLLVAETGRVLRFEYDPHTRRASAPRVLIDGLPRGGNHPYRTIVLGPDERLYLSIGSSCNVCEERDRRRAAILRYDPDGTGETFVATGVRNAVGIAFNPATGRLWATINERDWRGDDVPPDYISEIVEGGFYGWPSCYVQGRKVWPDTDPAFRNPEACARTTLPTLEIQAHSAPIGLAFYTGRQFPEEYRGDLFVAYQGSWNRTVPTGYKVVRVRMRDGQPVGIEDFATGWLRGGRAFGSLVDIIVGADGALYVSDQRAGAVYRIAYTGPR
jgi:glucose/arabinose dehydrogenase